MPFGTVPFSDLAQKKTTRQVFDLALYSNLTIVVFFERCQMDFS